MRVNDFVTAALLVAAILLVGAVDYFTGPDIGFSLFYMVPIAWAAWYLNWRLALGLALLASACWLGSELAWHGVNVVSLWNAFTRLGIYVLTAGLISRVRLDQRQLSVLNDRLKDLLAEEQHLARTDALTGLPNRRLFLDELRRAIERAQQKGEPIAMAYVDFDRFKTLNDRFGHATGDTLLQRAGEIIVGRLRPGDVAARIGSDDFGVLFDHCTEEDAGARAAQLHAGLSVLLAEDRFRGIGVSIGVACFEVPPPAPEALIDHADAAMYCARARRANSIYVVGMAAGAADRPARSI